MPVIEQQINLAGMRLANTLNEILNNSWVLPLDSGGSYLRRLKEGGRTPTKLVKDEL
jgi:hypothetical protein